MPVVLVGEAYWSKIINFSMFVEEGTIDKEDLKLFEYAETAEQVWEIIKKFYAK